MTPKREYKGPAIDMTEQYISERPNGGETIAGTTEDDLFGQATEWGLDEDDFTDKQLDALKSYLSYSNRDTVTMAEVAHGKDFSRETARRAVHKAFPDVRGFEDLTDSTKLAVLIWAHEGLDHTQSEVAEEYPVSSRALGDAKRIYPDLIEEKAPISEGEIEDAVEQYQQAHPASSEETSTQSYTNPGGNTPKDEKEYPEDFTEIYKWFIETIAENPSKTVGEIGNMIPEDRDYSPQNYYNVVKDYAHVIESRIEAKGSAESKDDLSDYLQEWIDLDECTESSTPEQPDDGDIDRRLRAVESKVEGLRQEIEGMENRQSNGSSGSEALAEVVIQSMSDEQLGAVIRGAMNDE